MTAQVFCHLCMFPASGLYTEPQGQFLGQQSTLWSFGQYFPNGQCTVVCCDVMDQPWVCYHLGLFSLWSSWEIPGEDHIPTAWSPLVMRGPPSSQWAVEIHSFPCVFNEIQVGMPWWSTNRKTKTHKLPTKLTLCPMPYWLPHQLPH